MWADKGLCGCFSPYGVEMERGARQTILRLSQEPTKLITGEAGILQYSFEGAQFDYPSGMDWDRNPLARLRVDKNNMAPSLTIKDKSSSFQGSHDLAACYPRKFHQAAASTCWTVTSAGRGEPSSRKLSR